MARSIFGKRILRLGTVSSTQDVLKNQFYEGAPEGTMAIAEEQTLGKGRQGRTWDSSAGKGLWVSLVIVPTGPEILWSWVPLWSGIVAKQAAKKLLKNDQVSEKIRLKWPNDLYYLEQKLGGILAEKLQADDGRKGLILGIGLNLTQRNDDFPPHLRKRAISLQEITGESYAPDDLLEELILTAEDLITLLKPVDAERIRDLWLPHAWGINSTLRVISGHVVLEGRFYDLGPHGELGLRVSQGDLRYIASSDGIEKVYSP